MQSPSEKRAGIHTYAAQWPIYSLAWSVRSDKRQRLAIGSFLEEYSNKVEVVQFNPDTSDFTTDNRLVFDHPYAPTNLMFLPSDDASLPDIIATSGDFLRLWQIKPKLVGKGLHFDLIHAKRSIPTMVEQGSTWFPCGIGPGLLDRVGWAAFT